MPRKKFEETPYDPFKAEQDRLEANTGGGGATPATTTATQPRPVPEPAKVVEIPRPSAPEPPRARPEPAPQPQAAYDIAKRFKVTEDEDAAYEEFILRLRSASKSKVDFSVLSRALWAVAQHAEGPLVEALQKARPPKRPSTNNPLAMAEYEKAWVDAVTTAFRRMGPPK